MIIHYTLSLHCHSVLVRYHGTEHSPSIAHLDYVLRIDVKCVPELGHLVA